MQPQFSWPVVLDQIEQALAGTLAVTAEREQALQADPLRAGAAGQPHPDPFREHLQALERCAAAAGGRVAAVESELATAEAALREWLQATEAARVKLADWVGRAVG